MTKTAYLVSKYPAVSHTFILREVRGLRHLGVHIETMTVRRPSPEELLSPLDHVEDSVTASLLPASPMRVMTSHLRELVRHPSAYLSTLRHAARLGGGGVRGAVWRLFYFAEAMLLVRWTRERGIDHVHAHFANVAADVALLAARYRTAAGAPLGWSFTMHGPTEFADVAGHRLARKVEEADAVVCISDFCRSQLMALVGERHWGKLEVVHCGIDVDAFAPATEPRPDDAPLSVLVLGRLVPEKGQALLLEAVAALRAAGRDVRLTVLGDGPDRGRLERLADRLGLRDVVHFGGAVPQTETAAWYQAADVFCLPSFAEGVPVVLMEAMATGLPVVTTRIAGIPELVEDGVSGRLVPPGRADLLASALAELADDPALRRRMGEAGRRAVCEEFDIRRSALRLLRILLEGRRRRPAAPASPSHRVVAPGRTW